MPGACERLRLHSLGTESTSSSGTGVGLQKDKRRVVVMGGARVGKSSIISQFLYDRFISRYKETVEELHRGKLLLEVKDSPKPGLSLSGRPDGYSRTAPPVKST
jgi:GTPase SAR1 and related small G proteins